MTISFSKKVIDFWNHVVSIETGLKEEAFSTTKIKHF
jgi:hypothetical protein